MRGVEGAKPQGLDLARSGEGRGVREARGLVRGEPKVMGRSIPAFAVRIAFILEYEDIRTDEVEPSRLDGIEYRQHRVCFRLDPG